MLKLMLSTVAVALGAAQPVMAQDRIRISTKWGDVTADLADNAAAKALYRMLPLTIEMRDHLRQEKTGNLPAHLPDLRRQQSFSTGTVGLWDRDHFVVYYRGGKVPQPGIVVLGKINGDASIFDRPGPVTVRLQRAN